MTIKIINAIDDTEIGESKIEVLAKEYCVCLSRAQILNKIIDQRVEKEGGDKDKITAEYSSYLKYSGVIRFMTLF
jgi:hypothetical protein